MEKFWSVMKFYNLFTPLLQPFYPSTNTISNTVLSSLTQVDSEPFASAQWRSIVWGRDRFAVVGNTNEPAFCKFSTDGTNWSPSSTIIDSPLGDGNPGGPMHSIVYSLELDLFVAGGANNVILTSTDANTWTSRNYFAGGGTLTGAAWSPTENIFVMAESGIFYTSNDGESWTKRTSVELAGNGYDNFITWSKLLNKFITSKNTTSIDGINWSGVQTAGANGIASADEIGLLVAGCYYSADVVVSSDHGKTWVLVNFDGDFATRSTRGVVWCKDIGIIAAVTEDRYTPRSTQSFFYSRDGFTWYKGPEVGQRQRCLAWSPELGLLVAPDRDSPSIIRRSSLKTIPTIQNVFNSEYNSINEQGEWSFGNVNATGDLIVGGRVGIGISDESELNKPKPRGVVMIESPAIDPVSNIQEGYFPEGNGQLAVVGGINEFGNTAGNGSLMVFCGSTKADGTDNYRSFGMIGAFKENETDGDRSGYLALGTRYNISPDRDVFERMRITSTGNVGIGTTSPFSERKLHVYNEKDSIIRIESNTESAQTEMVANLTAKTSGSISVNECHSVYRYTWNSSCWYR
jgi:hypothetical protein